MFGFDPKAVLTVVWWGSVTFFVIAALATVPSIVGAHAVEAFVGRRTAGKLCDYGSNIGLVSMAIGFLLAITVIVASWAVGLRNYLL